MEQITETASLRLKSSSPNSNGRICGKTEDRKVYQIYKIREKYKYYLKINEVFENFPEAIDFEIGKQTAKFGFFLIGPCEGLPKQFHQKKSPLIAS